MSEFTAPMHMFLPLLVSDGSPSEDLDQFWMACRKILMGRHDVYVYILSATGEPDFDLDRPKLPLFVEGLSEGVSGLRAPIVLSLMSVIFWRLVNYDSKGGLRPCQVVSNNWTSIASSDI